MSDQFGEQLAALRAQSLYRCLREVETAQNAQVDIAGRHLVNFSSNDYLGLANDPRLCAAATATINEFGVGAGASRLVCGTQSPHVRLERALANWKQAESAVTFSSGYAAAVGTIPALVASKDVVVLDKLCHASLVDGARLSGALLRVFPHNDVKKAGHHLEWARREHPESRVLLITESVFSMDGDLAPLAELIELKQRFNALLMLDEAHAVGVLGPHGRGLGAAAGLEQKIDVQMGTLSKALGVSGGYVCGTRDLIDWLINRARSFIFSTAPPPALAGAALAAVELLNSPEGEERRQLLARKIDLLSEQLPDPPGGTRGVKSGSAIFPWIVG
ncbi:MAG TPA: 8-amino-7-oxononanoate synthase, partial [Chthoniobacterales bacterium]